MQTTTDNAARRGGARNARAPTLFPELPDLPPVSGPCAACGRRPAVVGWTTTDPADVGGAVSSVGLCEHCARLVERFQLARDRAHEVARHARRG